MVRIDIELLDGKIFAKMMISGVNNLKNNQKAVDKLNVFPVPDGDTGTNMSLTGSAAVKELKLHVTGSVGEMAGSLAGAALRGARGNSGVILSQLWRGMSKELKELEKCDTRQFALALMGGVKTAYKSVMKPTEGTILTVAREAAEYAVRLTGDDQTVSLNELMRNTCEVARAALERTPEQLKVLKQAGVVDAGGAGLLYLYEGMSAALDGRDIESAEQTPEAEAQAGRSYGKIDTDDIKFSYCTEFIINKTNPDADVAIFSGDIKKIGDSMMVIDDEDIVKVHIHTNNPGYVLEKAVKIGSLTKIKIDNMKEQHNNILAMEEDLSPSRPVFTEPPTRYGFVSVCVGDGIEQVFRDLGANEIICGGQTMNPSTDDIIGAIDRINAENIFVLPNNKNIIMAAKQAKEISEKNIIIIETKNIAQGISAMFAFDPESEVEANTAALTEAIGAVQCGQVTYAVRDTSVDGMQITKGDILGMIDGQIKNIGASPYQVCLNLIEQMADEESSVITVLCGQDVDEADREKMDAHLTEYYKGMDHTVLDGGQPLYYYIVSVE